MVKSLDTRLEDWLRKGGCSLQAKEFLISGRRVDYVGLRERDDKTIAIEVKHSSSEFPMAIGQCLYYKRGADFVYIALPKEAIVSLSIADIKVLKSYGIGLLSLNENVQIVIEAKGGDPIENIVNELRNSSKQTKVWIHEVQRVRITIDKKNRITLPKEFIKRLGISLRISSNLV